MKWYFYLYFLCILQKVNGDFRIYGGHPAHPTRWKFIASLYEVRYEFHFCGASIIHRHFALTAAHCMVPPQLDRPMDINTIVVRAQFAENMNVNTAKFLIPIARSTIHPGYKKETWYIHDMAVLQLLKPLDPNLRLSHIKFKGRNDKRVCFTAGWGNTTAVVNGSKQGFLEEIEQRLTSDSKCMETFPDLYSKDYPQICTANIYETLGRPCSGDSGGPLICRANDRVKGEEDDYGYYSLIGVTSGQQVPCTTNKPVLFSSVALYENWITKILNKFEEVIPTKPPKPGKPPKEEEEDQDLKTPAFPYTPLIYWRYGSRGRSGVPTLSSYHSILCIQILLTMFIIV